MTKRLTFGLGFAALAALSLGARVFGARVEHHFGGSEPEPDRAYYYPGNFVKFTGHIQIYSIRLDDHEFEMPGGGLVPASMRALLIEPGPHRAFVTFVESTSVWPGANRPTVFSGWYQIDFEAKKGKIYVPIVRIENPKDQQLSEMCIAEAPQEGDLAKNLAATREKPQYVGCAKPTVDPYSDLPRRCKLWEPPPEGCRHNLDVPASPPNGATMPPPSQPAG